MFKYILIIEIVLDYYTSCIQKTDVQVIFNNQHNNTTALFQI